MPRRNIPKAADEQIKSLREGLTYWCSRHPKTCNRVGKKCINRNTCSESDCVFLLLDCNKTTYQGLEKQLEDSLKAKFIANYPTAQTIKSWLEDLGKGVELKFNDKFCGLLTYLTNFRENPSANDPELERTFDELSRLYQINDLTNGRKKADEAIHQYPIEVSEVIRWWALFYNRSKKWEVVREKLTEKISVKPAKDVEAECHIAIFESYLNQFVEERNKGDRIGTNVPNNK